MPSIPELTATSRQRCRIDQVGRLDGRLRPDGAGMAIVHLMHDSCNYGRLARRVAKVSCPTRPLGSSGKFARGGWGRADAARRFRNSGEWEKSSTVFRDSDSSHSLWRKQTVDLSIQDSRSGAGTRWGDGIAPENFLVT